MGPFSALLDSKAGHRLAVDEAIDPTPDLPANGDTYTRSATYAYDALYRLTSEAVSETLASGTQQGYEQSYAFDPVGNRLAKTVTAITGRQLPSGFTAGTTKSVYNARDQLLEQRDGAGNLTAAFGYDANGSLTTQRDGSGQLAKAYWYDLRNRLVQADANGDGSIDLRLGYDHREGRVLRQELTADGTVAATQKFLLDRANPTDYEQVLVQLDANGSPVRGWVLGQDVLAQADGPTVRTLLYDGHGSTRGVLDATGQLADGKVHSYDAFGVRTDGLASVLTPLQYAGEWVDPVTRLGYNRARPLDFETGRFTGRDPYEPPPGDVDNANLYGYAGGDPLNNIDPSGQFLQGIYVGRAAATITRFALTRNFTASWGAGRLLTEGIDWNGISDPFLLAGLHQLAGAAQLGDILSEARRGLAAVGASTAAMWDAWFAAWDDLAFHPINIALGMLGGRACFVAGTLVLLGYDAKGNAITKPIEEIEAGDLVLARDQHDGDDDLDAREVVRVFRKQSDHLRFVSYTDADGNAETLTTTDEHPFWVEGLGWLAAADLRPGMVLGDLDGTGGARLVVTANIREARPEGVTVYNFEVESDHTYFVEDGAGTQRWAWVHNTCTTSGGIKLTPYKGKGGDRGHHIFAKKAYFSDPRYKDFSDKALSLGRSELDRLGISHASDLTPVQAKHYRKLKNDGLTSLEARHHAWVAYRTLVEGSGNKISSKDAWEMVIAAWDQIDDAAIKMTDFPWGNT